MKNIINHITTLAVIMPVLAMGLIAMTPLTASAGEAKDGDTTNKTKCSTTKGTTLSLSVRTGSECAQADEQKGDLGTVIKGITQVLLFIIGAVAVIMIIIGGIRYTISNGDSSQITAAKNTILYGVIGLVVALLAFAIVEFVVGAFAGTAEGEGNGSAAS